MDVLRLSSVFAPAAGAPLGAARWDPVGGMQFHTAQLTQSLDQLDVRQTIVTAYRPGSPRREHPTPRTAVHRLGWKVPFLRQLYAVPSAVVLSRLIQGHDLLHAHMGEDLAVLPLALATSRRARVPLVVTIHCSLRHTLAVTDTRSAMLRFLGGPIERVAVRQADAVITLTKRARRAAVREGAPAGKVHVIPSGFEAPLFAQDLADPLPHIGRPRIVFIGRLTAQKGARTLLHALPHIRTPAHVVIVGDGCERRPLERLAHTIAGHRVHFTGFLPHTTVPAVLRSADVAVMPSAYEEMGSVLVEAMAAGAPIVATRVGGIPDLLDGGRRGILVPPGQPPALARGIDDVLMDQALAARLRVEGRRHVEHLSWGVLARRTLDVYADVLGDRL